MEVSHYRYNSEILINGYTTETYESLHKTYVKIPYRLITFMEVSHYRYNSEILINGYTTETYESLHKTYVKIPYRLSNKRDVETQIMKIIWRRAIILQKQMEKKYKTSVSLNYTSKLFDFKCSEASEFSVIMDTDELSNYQSNSETCYAQTLLVTQIILLNKLLHLALVQWYDFKFRNTLFVYSCPWLELVEKYNFIEIEVIEEIVHIVPRFDKKNEYFVNKYIF
ncbi:hypothetical protein Glove_230g171 [Diversispora epigaea]|uniref:Uncharacterized protein n=1 Tax=Diversispora epigaea TaxID=1348612 RepID=A0A397IKB5_9GLOM|nr:hypothetical protein Glove_230g171 [Diversispora epigaea]